MQGRREGEGRGQLAPDPQPKGAPTLGANVKLSIKRKI